MTHQAPEPALVHLLDRWTPSARIAVLTGAGISKASGVPTFRGTGGLWRHHRPEDLATPQAFARDPDVCWAWYDWRRQIISACTPNAAHEVVAAWSRRYPHVATITQNVDGLHERAGTLGVIRLHGSIWEVRCWQECRSGRIPTVDMQVPLAVLPPRCPHCGGLRRPGVVWFGEPLDPHVLAAATEAARSADIFLTVGTSSLVYPAASLVPLARDRGAFTVEINPDATNHSSLAHLVLRERAEVALVELDRWLRHREAAGGPQDR